MRAMKRAILIAVTVLCVQTGGVAHAAEPSWTILLVGGPGADSFRVALSPDGKTYEIDSVAPLEVGGKVCWHPEGDPLQLLCDAPMIAGFEVRGEGGDDSLEVSSTVRVPVTLIGGNGDDRMLGGSGDDRVTGGDGEDRITVGAGNDSCSGGVGNDIISGGGGNDTVVGDLGQDGVFGGYGDDLALGGAGSDTLGGGIGNDFLNGGAGNDMASGGPGNDRFVGGDRDKLIGGPGRDVLLPGNQVVY